MSMLTKKQKDEKIKNLLTGCEHDGSYIPVTEVTRLMNKVMNLTEKAIIDNNVSLIDEIIFDLKHYVNSSKMNSMFMEMTFKDLDELKEIIKHR